MRSNLLEVSWYAKKVSETEVKKPKAKKPSMELAVELPGAASIEVSLLDQAVEKINNVYRTNALETARGVAECSWTATSLMDPPQGC